MDLLGPVILFMIAVGIGVLLLMFFIAWKNKKMRPFMVIAAFVTLIASCSNTIHNQHALTPAGFILNSLMTCAIYGVPFFALFFVAITIKELIEAAKEIRDSIKR